MKILHISDVHFGVSDMDGDQEQVTRNLVSTVRRQKLRADFICFTGDLAQSATATQFKQGEDWLVELSELTGGKILLCPGNHDANRAKADTRLLQSAVQSKQLFGQWKTEIYKNHPHLKDFCDWVSSANDDYSCFANKWDNPSVDVYEDAVAGYPVTFVCANTALVSHRDGEQGALAVDIKAIQGALGKAADRQALTILLAHHPSDWLVDWCKLDFEKHINRSTGPHIFLHGHMHDQGSKSFFFDDGRSVATISAGACYQGTTWPQLFNLLEIDIQAGTLSGKVFEFNDNLGEWEITPKRGRQIPIALPQWKTKAPSDPASSCSIPTAYDEPKFKNPFDFVTANDMAASEIPKLFVEKNVSLQTIRKHFDAFVEGQRGTGKTMLLRYFSSEVQSLQNSSKNIEDQPFVGVYCRMSQHGFNRTDLDAVENKKRKLDLFEHRITAFLFSKLFASLDNYYDPEDPIVGPLKLIAQRASQALRNVDIAAATTWGELSETVDIVANDIMQAVDEHLASLQPGANQSSYNTWLTVSHTFVTFLGRVQKLLHLNGPFFLLLDDFDALDRLQQHAIFSTAAERNHSIVCFKFGSMTYGCPSKQTLTGQTYREGDDYDQVSLNWIDKGLHNNSGNGSYSKIVQEVARKRLENAGWPAERSWASYLGTWEHGNRIRDELKHICLEQYNNLPANERHNSFQSYWDKQKNVEFLRHLKKKKIENRYAGITAVVDLSSGIFRQFLELCSRIVSAAFANDWQPDSPKQIGQGVQSFAIKRYSNDMISSIGETAGDSSRREFGEYEITSQHLVNLVRSLCRMFHYRLYDTSISDADVIDFAVKGESSNDGFAQAILRVAVRESIIHRKELDYPDKSDSSKRLPTYTLNRRLIPSHNLGLRMTGRVELSLDQVELASRDVEAFLEGFKIQSGSKQSMRRAGRKRDSRQKSFFEDGE